MLLRMTNLSLKEARKQRAITLAALAEAVGTDVGNMSRIERGQQMPGRELAARLHAYFDGAVDWPAILGITDADRRLPTARPPGRAA